MPIDPLLEHGFAVRQTSVRPANSVSTAFQLIAVLFQIQSLQQFGGVSATHLDWSLVPYVRKSFAKHYRIGLKYIADIEEPSDEMATMIANAKDYSIEHPNYQTYNKTVYRYAYDMLKRDIAQSAEAFLHNLNTLQSRSGNQLPFSSVNYGTCTLVEGRLVVQAILECTIKGNGIHHLTPIFPCQIFQCMKGVNRAPGDPNYDLYQLALKCTAKRLYPNYVNVDWTNNAGYDVNDPTTYMSTMGCRTSNGYDVNAEPGVNPQTKDGRGNICPVTIILPTIAMQARLRAEANDWDVVETFMSHLDHMIHDAKDMLIERFEYICSQTADSARFMYENNTMLGYHPEEGIRSALKHGTLAIGQLGLAEALQVLIGCDHTDMRGMELAKQIEKLFNQRCAEFKEEYRLNFGVYMTPAENLSHTACEKFKARYGEIPNVSDKKFFTNSMHVPVWKNISAFDKIDLESQLTGYSNAGCITYVEIDGGVKNNTAALEILVNYAMDKDIPYFAINVPVDECHSCGYTDEMEDTCPECGGHVCHLRRVTGYLSGDYKFAFNAGKQQEVEMRVKHR